MEEIILIGAGGLAREIIGIISDNIYHGQNNQKVIGLLDDNIPKGTLVNNLPVLGKINEHNNFTSMFVIAIANPPVKEKIFNLLGLPLDRFANIISFRSIQFSLKVFGFGNVIYPNAILSNNVSIYNLTTILPSTIGHDAIIGNFTTISGNCSINGFVNIGKSVFIGSNASIQPGITVEDYVKLGANSHLFSKTKKGKSYYGVPALLI
jgi:sugar O-acyltransferase (sialic acid O-acetyltransferase NeuD family)